MLWYKTDKEPTEVGEPLVVDLVDQTASSEMR
jgi:hypothetical protein